MRLLRAGFMVLGLVLTATLAAVFDIPGLYAAAFGYACGVGVTAVLTL